MGASLIHGQRLFLGPRRYHDGSVVEELFAEAGDWVGPSYSSVTRMVDFCAERGVPESDWPIFYGTWQGDVDLDEVTRRCDRLRPAIVRLSASECAKEPWLEEVRRWLAQGEVFAVFE